MKLRLTSILVGFIRRDSDGKWFCRYGGFGKTTCEHTEDSLIGIAKHYTEVHLQNEIDSHRATLMTEGE